MRCFYFLLLFTYFWGSLYAQEAKFKKGDENLLIPKHQSYKSIQVQGHENPDKSYTLKDTHELRFNILEKVSSGGWSYYKVQIKRVDSEGNTSKAFKGAYRISVSELDKIADFNKDLKNEVTKATKDLEKLPNGPQAKKETCEGCEEKETHDPDVLKISDKAIDLIKEFEGFEENIYLDCAGHATVGYGHLLLYGKSDSCVEDQNELKQKAKAELKKLGYQEPLSEKDATSLLKVDAEKVAAIYIKKYVKVSLTQNQFDALTSFVFNIGQGNFKDSTVLKRLNQGDYEGAADAITWWNKAGGKVMRGLVKRREKEKELFLKED